jgi:hypothetical protein
MLDKFLIKILKFNATFRKYVVYVHKLKFPLLFSASIPRKNKNILWESNIYTFTSEEYHKTVFILGLLCFSTTNYLSCHQEFGSGLINTCVAFNKTVN